jgi:hypothetical protein
MSQAHTTTQKSNLIRDIIERKSTLTFKGGRLGITHYQPFEQIGKQLGLKSETKQPKDTSIKVADHDEPETVGVKVKTSKAKTAAKPVERPSTKPLAAMTLVPPLSSATMQRPFADVADSEEGELHAPLAAAKDRVVGGYHNFTSYIGGVASAVAAWLSAKHILRKRTNTVNSGLYGYSLNLAPARVKVTAAVVTGVMAVGLLAALLGNVPGIPDLMGGGKGNDTAKTINVTNAKSTTSTDNKKDPATNTGTNANAASTTPAGNTSAAASSGGGTFINDPVAPVTGGRGSGNIVQDTQQQTGGTVTTPSTPTPTAPAPTTILPSVTTPTVPTLPSVQTPTVPDCLCSALP